MVDLSGIRVSGRARPSTSVLGLAVALSLSCCAPPAAEPGIRIPSELTASEASAKGVLVGPFDAKVELRGGADEQWRAELTNVGTETDSYELTVGPGAVVVPASVTLATGESVALVLRRAPAGTRLTVYSQGLGNRVAELAIP